MKNKNPILKSKNDLHQRMKQVQKNLVKVHSEVKKLIKTEKEQRESITVVKAEPKKEDPQGIQYEWQLWLIQIPAQIVLSIATYYIVVSKSR